MSGVPLVGFMPRHAHCSFLPIAIGVLSKTFRTKWIGAMQACDGHGVGLRLGPACLAFNSSPANRAEHDARSC